METGTPIRWHKPGLFRELIPKWHRAIVQSPPKAMLPRAFVTKARERAGRGTYRVPSFRRRDNPWPSRLPGWLEIVTHGKYVIILRSRTDSTDDTDRPG